MQAAPLPSQTEQRANAAFDAVLWALSRPGLTRILPAPSEAAIIEALLDRECQVHTADVTLMPALMQTGAHIVDLPQADHVFLGDMPDIAAVPQLRIGSDLYPDDGATVIVRAQFGQGQALRLTGPGVNGHVDVRIAGLPAALWDARARAMRYPMGFDILLIDGAQVMGLPRSTKIEVL